MRSVGARADAPRGKRVLRGKRGGKVSKNKAGITYLKVSTLYLLLHPLCLLAPQRQLALTRSATLKTNN